MRLARDGRILRENERIVGHAAPVKLDAAVFVLANIGYSQCDSSWSIDPQTKTSATGCAGAADEVVHYDRCIHDRGPRRAQMAGGGDGADMPVPDRVAAPDVPHAEEGRRLTM
jgi:hypothetical protein